jgi:O-antigen biosynthesis protein
VNGLVVDWDDPKATARALDVLAADRQLLHELRLGALETARAWPSWHQASSFMALALRRIAEEPPPDAATFGPRMSAGIVTAIADAQTRHIEAEQARLSRQDLLDQRAVQLGLKARRYATLPRRAVRAVRRRVGSS